MFPVVTILATGVQRRRTLHQLRGRLGETAQRRPQGTAARMVWLLQEHGSEVATTVFHVLSAAGIDPNCLSPQPTDPLLPWLAERAAACQASRRATMTRECGLDWSWLRTWETGGGTVPFRNVADWYVAVRPPLDDDLSLGSAATAARKWHGAIAEREAKIPEIQEPVVWRWDDGWYVVRLETWPQFQQESRALGHCIGEGDHYFRKWGKGEYIYHSLRMPSGEPVATSEERGSTHYLLQLKGRRDMLLTPPHRAHAQGLRFARTVIPLPDGTRAFEQRSPKYMGYDALALLPFDELVTELRRATIERDLGQRCEVNIALEKYLLSGSFPAKEQWTDSHHEQDYDTEAETCVDEPTVVAATVYLDRPFPAPDDVLTGAEERVNGRLDHRLNRSGRTRDDGKVEVFGWSNEPEHKAAKYKISYKDRDARIDVWGYVHNMAGISIAFKPVPDDGEAMVVLDVTIAIGIATSDGAEIGRTDDPQWTSSSGSDPIIHRDHSRAFTIPFDPGTVAKLLTEATAILDGAFKREHEEGFDTGDEGLYYWKPRGSDDDAWNDLYTAWERICGAAKELQATTNGPRPTAYGPASR